MKIHVTSVNDCPRKTWHKIKQRDKELPPHYLAVKGIMAHAIMEMASKGEEVNLQYPNLIEHGSRNNSTIDQDIYDKAIPEVERLIGNFNTWGATEESKVAENMTQEETQEMSYNGHILTGTPDAYGQNFILDYKTGKPVLRQEYKEQLAAYRWMLSSVEKCMPDAKGGILFLGADEPVFKEVGNSDLTKALESFKQKLDTHIMYINEIEKDANYLPPCQFGMGCAFCGWRHLCRGI